MAYNKKCLKNLTLSGKGRKKGAKNKFTDLKKSFLDAFEQIGGTEGLAKWAMDKRNRAAFYNIVSKLLPTQIRLDTPIVPDKIIFEHKIMDDPRKKKMKELKGEAK